MKKLIFIILLLITSVSYSQMQPSYVYMLSEHNNNTTYISYDGVDEYTLLTALVTMADPFMVSFWLYNNGGAGTLIGSRNASHYFIWDNNLGDIFIKDYNYVFDNRSLSFPASWVNCVLIRNGNKVDFYINNSYIDTWTDVAWTANFCYESFGARIAGGVPKAMFFDEMCSYSTAPALYSGTVPPVVTYLYGGGTPETRGYPPDAPTYGANIVHYYDFETGTGTVVYDKIGAINGNNTNMDNTNWRNY